MIQKMYQVVPTVVSKKDKLAAVLLIQKQNQILFNLFSTQLAGSIGNCYKIWQDSYFIPLEIWKWDKEVNHKTWYKYVYNNNRSN